MKLGDAIASISTPIARTLGMDCIDPQTSQLRPESPCAQAKNRLNNGEALFTVLYDRFFEKRTKGEKVKFILQLEVETEKVSNIDLKAIEAASSGSVLSVNPRPQPPTQQVTQRPGVPQIKPNG